MSGSTRQPFQKALSPNLFHSDRIAIGVAIDRGRSIRRCDVPSPAGSGCPFGDTLAMRRLAISARLTCPALDRGDVDWRNALQQASLTVENIMGVPSGEFDFVDAGSGPAVLSLPGSFGTGMGWKAVLGHLGDGCRTVTTSLLGYGLTTDIRPDGNATMSQQVDLIDRIIDRIGSAPHVVGHSYGGLSALVHALTGRHAPASLLLVEANPLGLLRTAGDLEHYAMFESMTGPYFAEFARGNAEAARHVIDFYGGEGTFDAMPPKVRDYVMANTAVNVRDWTSGTPFEPSQETLESIRVPTTLVRGGNTHPAMRRIAELLHDAIPDSKMVAIAGGSHFLPSTHPAEIAALVRRHVDGVAILQNGN